MLLNYSNPTLTFYLGFLLFGAMRDESTICKLFLDHCCLQASLARVVTTSSLNVKILV